MKKILLNFILGVIFVSFSCVFGSEKQSIEFTLDELGTTIIGYTGNSETILIPTTINGNQIIGISDTFDENSPNKTNVKKIHFKKDSKITSISSNTQKSPFNDFSNLQEIILPENFENIGDYAFANCNNLTKIQIPNTVKNVGAYAFSNCSNLEYISLPGATNIGNYAFANTGAAKINFPVVEHIGASVFENKKFPGFESINPEEISTETILGIYLPNTVTSVDNNIFKNATGLGIYFDKTISEGSPLLFNALKTAVPSILLYSDQFNSSSDCMIPEYVYSSSFPEYQPTIDVQNVLPNISTYGQTIINIGISKDDIPPDRLCVTMPINLAILIHSFENSKAPVDVYIGGG